MKRIILALIALAACAAPASACGFKAAVVTNVIATPVVAVTPAFIAVPTVVTPAVVSTVAVVPTVAVTPVVAVNAVTAVKVKQKTVVRRGRTSVRVRVR